jgi:TolB-like protein
VPSGSNAVFLSYASEDAEAAAHIAQALSDAGVEVWFDKSELRGGDAWDRMIRRQIRECTLFVPIISEHSQARPEGYFRLEWDLADQRTHLMGRSRAFVVPVCLDATLEKEADVPDSFAAVQWTRLPGGETPPAFVDRVRRLLSGEAPATIRAPSPVGPIEHISASRSTKRALLAAITVLILGAAAYLGIHKRWSSNPAASGATISGATARATATAFSPPPHSIAVLPFTNLSGDKDQEYFSDGISEELINALAHIDGLQVIARTSAFSFKGQTVDIGTIARKLNVGAILEGSVRRERNRVRVTTQLINSVNGFHIWSENYDRDATSFLAIESEIATAVAQEMRIKLLGGEVERIEAGGTRNLDAHEAYLRGWRLYNSLEPGDFAGKERALAEYNRAIALDPSYAAAYAQRARVLSSNARDTRDFVERDRLFREARVAAERAVNLAPESADAHVALGWHVALFESFDLRTAEAEISRAMSLAPGSAYVLRTYASFALIRGDLDAGLSAARRAVNLDPESAWFRQELLFAWLAKRSYDEVFAQVARMKAKWPDLTWPLEVEASVYLRTDQPNRAIEVCTASKFRDDDDYPHYCLSRAYYALGRRADSDRELAALQTRDREYGAVRYAELYAQRGRIEQALQWLAVAEKRKVDGLLFLKTDWELDPIRNTPEFKALERRLNFPP